MWRIILRLGCLEFLYLSCFQLINIVATEPVLCVYLTDMRILPTLENVKHILALILMNVRYAWTGPGMGDLTHSNRNVSIEYEALNCRISNIHDIYSPLLH